MQMNDNDILNEILFRFNLGAFITLPQRVSGGYMHKMYKLDTTTGKYALKLLNPSIMKREDAFQNYARAERLEDILAKHNIPIVPALEIGGQKMQCVNNQYFYIFPWIEGTALNWKDITSEHCRIAGTLLAQIHKVEIKEEPFISEKLSIDWDAYISLSRERCPEITDILIDNRDLLYSAQIAYNDALMCTSVPTCICDGDMDSKNVLWHDGKPLIIDLESLDYGNPFLEMFKLALDWSGGVLCQIDYNLLNGFILAYKQEFGSFDVDWHSLSGIGFSWLEWLDYNIKRALLIECANKEEQQLGISQVQGTVPRIIYYDSIRAELRKCLDAFK